MLALTDERWILLSHAYGNAADVPAMLGELKRLEKIDTVEDDLFYAYLCHQDTTYTASYAAIPHIVDIALQENQILENQIALVCFCGDVHASKNGGKEFYIDSDDENLVNDLNRLIEESYLKAIEKIKPLARRFLNDGILDEGYRAWVFAAFLAFEGFETLSIFLEGFGTEIIFPCLHCENENPVYLYGLRTKSGTDEHYFELNPAEIKLETSPVAPSKENAPEWILFYAEKYDVEPVKHQIPDLFGTMICPDCAKEFRIIDAL